VLVVPASNGEFVPPPASPVVREAIRRANAEAEVLARRLGMSRRRFLASLGGSALTLMVLDACASAERATRASSTTTTSTSTSTSTSTTTTTTTSTSTTTLPPPTTLPPTTTGGTYEIPPEATTEPEVAEQVLAGDEFVMDLQAHLLDYDLTPDVPWDGTPFLGQLFPQIACGETDPRACFSIEAFLDLFFLQSDTSLAVLSAIPVPGPDNPLSAEVMVATQRMADALCAEGRVLAHGQAMPNLGDPAAMVESMAGLRDRYPIIAWKAYTHLPAAVPFFLDDHDPDGVPVGRPFLEAVRQVGPPVVCVHKGFRGVGGGSGRFADPVDIGPAAAANPDISFVVYHSGFEADVAEGHYDPSAPNGGVDRLIASLERAGVGPGRNVYAELGSTWRFLMSRPDQAAHVLGKLLSAVGVDNVVWGTDCLWYGSPQDQIEAFRAFAITEAYQEVYGYPALTPEVKAGILGRNAARLHGVEPVHRDCSFSRSELRQIRAELALPTTTLGPATAEEAARAIAAHLV
jgi:hypothetical protein